MRKTHIKQLMLAVALGLTGVVALMFLWGTSVVSAQEECQYESTVLVDDPFAYWRLNESSSISKAVNIGFVGDVVSGTYEGGVTLGQSGLVTGDSDPAALFDGVNDFVDIPNDSYINFPLPDPLSYTQKTAELWFKPSRLTGKQVLYEQGGISNGLNIFLDDNHLNVGVWANSVGNWVSTTVTIDTIYHVALVFDGNNQMLTGYLNGAAFGSVSTVISVPEHIGLVGIGAANDETRYSNSEALGPGGNGAYFEGIIDEVALYDAVLSADRIAAHAGTCTPVHFSPVLQIAKSGPSSGAVGSSVTYSFDVSHAAGSDGSAVGNMSVSDTVAGPASLSSGDTNSNGKLDGDETWVYTVSYTIQPTDPNPLVNSATVEGKDLEGDDVSATSNTHSLSVTHAPALSISKDGPASANVGDNVTYTFDVSHAAGSDGSAVGNLTVSDSVAGPASLSSGDTNSDGKLDEGETWHYTVSYTIQPADPHSLVNSATVEGEDLEGGDVSATSNSHTLTVAHAPVLSISKDGPASATVGDNVTYTFDVSHAAGSDGSPVSNLTVSDTVAGAASLSSGDANTNDKLDEGETWVYTVSYTVKPADPHSLVNSATVEGQDLDGDDVSATSNTHSLSVAHAPVLQITKSGPSSAAVGSSVTYTFDVSHATGSDGSPVSNMSVSDTVAGAASLSSGDTNSDGKLDEGETWHYTVSYTIQPDDDDPLVNSATVQGEDLDGDEVSATSNTHSLSITHAPVLSISKSGPATANVGDSVTFTFEVSHAASSDGSSVSDLAVSDSVAGPATLDASGDTNHDNLLDAGETWVYTASYTIQPLDPTPLVNVGSVTGKNIEGNTVTANDSHSTDLVGFAPDLEIEANWPASAMVGDTIAYTFTVKHSATSDGSPVSNLGVSDTLVGSLTRTGGDDGDNLLEAGESWVYSASYTILDTDPDPLTNTVTATGQDQELDPVTVNAEYSTPLRIRVFLPMILAP